MHSSIYVIVTNRNQDKKGYVWIMKLMNNYIILKHIKK